MEIETFFPSELSSDELLLSLHEEEEIESDQVASEDEEESGGNVKDVLTCRRMEVTKMTLVNLLVVIVWNMATNF